MMNMFYFDEPLEAVWRSQEYDIPIIITGFSKKDHDLFFSIKGSKTCIPIDQIEFNDKDIQEYFKK